MILETYSFLFKYAIKHNHFIVNTVDIIIARRVMDNWWLASQSDSYLFYRDNYENKTIKIE